VEVVSRSHRHTVCTGRLDGQQVAAAGRAQADILIEDVGRFAGRADDGVLHARGVVRGGDILDVVVGAVEGRADQLGHRTVDDHQTAARGGGLVVEHRADQLAALADNRTAELEVHLAVAYVQVVAHDGEQRREVGDRLVFGHVVVDAQTAAYVHEAEPEAQTLQIPDDRLDLDAHILENVQLADLRPDMEVNADDVEVREAFDFVGVFLHLLVRDAELAVGLARVDAVVGLGVDVGVDTQGDVDRAAGLGCQSVQDVEFLDGLAVDRQDILLDGVTQLLVAFAHAGVDDGFGVETRLDGLAQFVAAGAVDTEPVLADDGEQMVVVVGLDGIVNLVGVFV